MIGRGQDDGELITAVASGQVTGAHAGAQGGGDSEEGLIAGLMAERVIDRAKIVEVDHQEREGLGGAESAFDLLGQPHLKSAMVEQPRERVLRGLGQGALVELDVL